VKHNQEQAARLVQREVYQCVSSLVSGLAQIAHQLDCRSCKDAFGIDQDELIDLCQRPNYEDAAREFILDDADIDDLESIANAVGRWEDILAWSKVPEVSEDEDGMFRVFALDEAFDTEEEAQEAAIEAALPEIRKQVLALVPEQSEFQNIVQDHNLDYDYDEVYEHWLVSDWLARRLVDKGEITGEVAGLTVWGRCCTGQSICMDSVIQEIATSLWGNE